MCVCVSMCLCVCVCMVTSQAHEALSCHHTLQLPVFLQASLPAADLFELGMRESFGGKGSEAGMERMEEFCYLTRNNITSVM